MKTVKEYLNDSTHCPRCNSDEIEAGDKKYDGIEIEIETQCLECLFVWTDIYKLSNARFDQ
jgi:hypothetical protein